jgi:hypothetical protein
MCLSIIENRVNINTSFNEVLQARVAVSVSKQENLTLTLSPTTALTPALPTPTSVKVVVKS